MIEKLAAKGVLGGVPVSRLEPDRPELADLIVVAATEVNTDEDRAAYAKALKEVLLMHEPVKGRPDRAPDR